MQYDLWLGIPYDFIPFMLIICLHRKNFKKEKVTEKYAYAEDFMDPQTARSSTLGTVSEQFQNNSNAVIKYPDG